MKQGYIPTPFGFVVLTEAAVKHQDLIPDMFKQLEQMFIAGGNLSGLADVHWEDDGDGCNILWLTVPFTGSFRVELQREPITK